MLETFLSKAYDKPYTFEFTFLLSNFVKKQLKNNYTYIRYFQEKKE